MTPRVPAGKPPKCPEEVVDCDFPPRLRVIAPEVLSASEAPRAVGCPGMPGLFTLIRLADLAEWVEGSVVG